MQAISRLLNTKIQESITPRDERLKYEVTTKILSRIIQGLQSETSSEDIALLFEHLQNAKGASLPEVQAIVKQLSWIVPKGIYLQDAEQSRFVDVTPPPDRNKLVLRSGVEDSGPECDQGYEVEVLSALTPESLRETHCELYRQLTLLEGFWRTIFTFPRVARQQYPSVEENDIVLDMFVDALGHYIPFSHDARVRSLVVAWLNAEIFDILCELHSLYDTHEQMMIRMSPPIRFTSDDHLY